MDLWRPLIRRAVARLEQIGLGNRDWTWGGDTMLMKRHQHRMSRDINIFLNDVQHLSYLSPRLDGCGMTELLTYLEQANFLRLEFNDGEIDFLVVARVFPHLRSEYMKIDDFGGEIQVMPDKEILGQKLYYRAAGFTGRDLYDFVSVTQANPYLRKDAELRALARLRADALEMSLSSPKCEDAYSRINTRSIHIPFAAARADLLEWVREEKPAPTVAQQ